MSGAGVFLVCIGILIIILGLFGGTAAICFGLVLVLIGILACAAE